LKGIRHLQIAALSADTLIQTSFIIPSTTPDNLGIAKSNLLDFVKSLYNADGTTKDQGSNR
jgi:GDP-D-mannose dehydratase